VEEGVWIEAKIREIKKGRLGLCDAVGWIDLLSISGSNILRKPIGEGFSRALGIVDLPFLFLEKPGKLKLDQIWLLSWIKNGK
jgi:hypothetical protein